MSTSNSVVCSADHRLGEQDHRLAELIQVYTQLVKYDNDVHILVSVISGHFCEASPNVPRFIVEN